MSRFTRPALAAALAAVVSACASVPMATPELDLAAKEFRAPAPGQANVYVYRNEAIGAAVRQDLLLDGVPVGQTAAKTFFLLPVSPGPHKLTSKSENTSELPLTAEAGRSYFVWQEVKMGILMARTKLQLVNEEEGKKGVLECKLAQTIAPDAATPPPAPAPAPAAVPNS